MHRSAKLFCKSIKERFPQFFKNKTVLDCGSLDVNGNNKYLFKKCTYTGIDVGPGANVDIVTSIHEYITNPVDVIISTECFEHDMYYKESFKHIVYDLLKPGGLFFFTCASTNRKEHGTVNTSPSDAPLLKEEWAHYYKNLTEDDIRNVINVDMMFDRYEFSTDDKIKDLYFWGIKKTN